MQKIRKGHILLHALQLKFWGQKIKKKCEENQLKIVFGVYVITNEMAWKIDSFLKNLKCQAVKYETS